MEDRLYEDMPERGDGACRIEAGVRDTLAVGIEAADLYQQPSVGVGLTVVEVSL